MISAAIGDILSELALNSLSVPFNFIMFTMLGLYAYHSLRKSVFFHTYY